jgi:2-keto-4-pentenoate hydratase
VIPSVAQLLSQSRIRHSRLAELPAGVRPQSPDEAYQCQQSVVAHLLDHYGGRTVGYKVACTNLTAQRQLHVDQPFSGRLLSAFCSDSPAVLDASQFFMRVIEAEFGFQMACDLPPGAWSRDEIAAAVEGVLPGIEVVDSRFESWTTIGAPSLIADNACNAAYVRGSLIRDWRSLDLAAQAVRVTVNGELVREGRGSAVLGHPLAALEWLVSHLSGRGLGLEAGQYVTTGVTTEVYFAEPGDRVLADFGDVGRVELTFR